MNEESAYETVRRWYQTCGDRHRRMETEGIPGIPLMPHGTQITQALETPLGLTYVITDCEGNVHPAIQTRPTLVVAVTDGYFVAQKDRQKPTAAWGLAVSQDEIDAVVDMWECLHFNREAGTTDRETILTGLAVRAIRKWAHDDGWQPVTAHLELWSVQPSMPSVYNYTVGGALVVDEASFDRLKNPHIHLETLPAPDFGKRMERQRVGPRDYPGEILAQTAERLAILNREEDTCS